VVKYSSILNTNSFVGVGLERAIAVEAEVPICRGAGAMVDIALIQTICHMLDGLLTEDNVPPHSASELYEKFFVFTCIWAFGGPLPSDGRIDYRNMFSNWWKKELQSVKVCLPCQSVTICTA
jgi:hypothetical protein